MSFRLHTITAIAIATLLNGCTGTTLPAAPLPPLADCGAADLQDLLGQPVRGSSASDATIGGVPVRSKGDVRVIAPGQAVIQNYSEARLNLETGAAGNLVRASCG
jgi:hypothetical protein